MRKVEKIPFRVEMDRIVELLARQIYQSPLALLRENCQNAYDAILQRKYRGDAFDPQITVQISTNEIVVADNGIGMTKAELVNNYWHAGASGKNTPEARAAGVVGTFGIGAMANFGVASELWVETESATSQERTVCFATKETLSASEDCIQLTPTEPLGLPGTTVRAVVGPGTLINISAASAYLTDCVRYLQIPVSVNGSVVSLQEFESGVPRPSGGLVQESLPKVSIGGQLTAHLEIVDARTGEVWVAVRNIRDAGSPIEGILLLRQGAHQIKAFRSRFALAQAGVSSVYGFGGIANLMSLEPTAGREALTTASLQLLQQIITECEKHVSLVVAQTDFANQNTGFMEWAYQHGRVDLCSKLQVRVEPNNRSVALGEIRRQSESRSFNYYEGTDPALINQFANEDQPLIVISTRQPRRKCEVAYLRKHTKTTLLSDAPTVLSRKLENDLTLAESTLALRIVSIVESDYFVQSRVSFGKMSHKLSIYTDPTSRPVDIVLDPDSSTIATILKVYETDYIAITGLVKDFIRTAIFPKIAHLVPSSTRQGAEAFLRAIRKPRDLFEYEKADLGSLADIWKDYLDGKISISEAARQSEVVVKTSIQVVDRAATSQVAALLPDVLENEQILFDVTKGSVVDELEASPAITRLQKESSAKLLVIDDGATLKGYRCFLAITDRVRRDRGEFFLQPHRTEIVWGGQKVLYIFQHHSGEFGLYYELQGKDIFAEKPGGRAFPTCTIVVKNQVYIPVPDELASKFIPIGVDKKSFEIRCELLYPEIGSRPGSSEAAASATI